MTGALAVLASYKKKSPQLVLNLDAANYSAVPTNGSTIAGVGGYTITTRNANSSMTWAATNGGIFRKTSGNTADFLEFGPDYSVTTKPYTVMMVYRSQAGVLGRLLNANTASPDWLLGLWGSGAGVQNIFFNGAFVGSSSTAQDGNWQFIWGTYNGKPGSAVSNNYVANSSQPTTTFGTGSSGGGFNQLRLFGRYANATTNTEVVTADVGVVKVWDDALSLSEIQTEYAAYKTRFGY